MTETKKELNMEELEKAAGGAYQRYFRYIVQSGDTLESVAKHFYMSVEDLKSLNNISGPEDFYAGLQITVPMPGC
ncbi:MAG: LysM domain-containing protein [Clostridia bacterium]|nr:LysM domain-containing protein [Clostridia bacterium]